MAESNSNPSANPFCKNDCGFYASSQFDGMCSKCHKENVQQDQDKSAGIMGLTISPHVLVTPPQKSEDTLDDISNESITASIPIPGHRELADPIAMSASPMRDGALTLFNSAPSSPSTSSERSCSPGGTRRFNRCQICRKKVGLTGLPCHCGGLFCPKHRYADQHSCDYDYRGRAQEDIRRDNPEIRASKLNKI